MEGAPVRGAEAGSETRPPSPRVRMEERRQVRPQARTPETPYIGGRVGEPRPVRVTRGGAPRTRAQLGVAKGGAGRAEVGTSGLRATALTPDKPSSGAATASTGSGGEPAGESPVAVLSARPSPVPLGGPATPTTQQKLGRVDYELGKPLRRLSKAVGRWPGWLLYVGPTGLR